MYFTVGVLVGYLFWRLFAGKRAGDKIERSIRLSIGNHYLHVHHWIWCSIALVIALFIGFNNLFILGFLIGSIIQGLLYRDRFVIFYKKEDFEKIYSRFR